MALKRFHANRKSVKGKQIKWRKGCSSDYNPGINKHRNEAKYQSKFVPRGKNSNLTSLAVAQHNRQNEGVTAGAGGCESNMDGVSEAGLTFVTNFSSCTNPTFTRLLSNWQSSSLVQKEMLAVLAAITEVIQAKGGDESDTEYFAALMTTLKISESNESRTAIFTLLKMVVRRLSASVLKQNFDATCPILKDLLIENAETDLNCLLKNLVSVLASFLKVQDANSWNDKALECYSAILQFTTHQKPKVRKVAQDAIVFLLNYYTNKENVHPACAVTAKFCEQLLESCTGSDSTTFCHILNLLKNIMHHFPKSTLKSCCEMILRFMTLNDPVVGTTCLHTIAGMFSSDPKPECLPHVLNIRLIQALYDYEPNVNDGFTLVAWLRAMESGFINLYRRNANTCLKHLPKFIKTCVASYLSEASEVHDAVTILLQNILRTCVVPSSAEVQQYIQVQNDNPLHEMFKILEKTLSYQYHKVWKQVITILGTCFDVMGKDFYPVMEKSLQSMADLRESVKFAHIAELDKALGVAIHRMGPQIVLSAVPLLSSESEQLDFSRSWLLPLLRDNIKETKLSFFVQYFLPLASRIKQGVAHLEAQGHVDEAKTQSVVCSQIWSLLPGFCTLPTDLKESWKTIAKILGTTLSEYPSLRMTILTSLRTLIAKNLDNEGNRQEIGKYAKNYLPILFNLYTTESRDKAEEGVRLSVFDTIKAYLEVTDKELCKSFFSKAHQKLKEADAFNQHALLDITKLLVIYVDQEEIRELYEYCKPLLQNTNHTVQKKAYSVMNVVCSAASESCKAFAENNVGDLKSLMQTSLPTLSPPSKALRLSCLSYISEILSSDSMDFIVNIVPEACLCTKETSVKTRAAAFRLLSTIGAVLLKWKPDDKKGALSEYLNLLFIGFAQGPHMISATILALGHVVYEYKGLLDSDLRNLMIENVCLLLTSRSREIVTAGLSFIKILFSSFSTEELAPHVTNLVQSIGNITEDNQRALRFTSKELFVRLIRKFGFEMISEISPEQFQKQLNHIRKMEARKTKKQQSDSRTNTEPPLKKRRSDTIEDVLEDTDDDYDDDEEEEAAETKPQKAKKTWIEERENEIVDFLDPSANKKVLVTKPADSKKEKKSTMEFEISKDGRIIIPNEKEEGNSKTGKGKSDQDVTMEGSCESGSKKRKYEDMSDEEDEEPIRSTSKPVLKGIHRTVKSVKPSREMYKAKKAGGDVKRGKLEPYSYIPLNKQMLNKRKAKKRVGQFKGVVRAAKRGAMKGRKSKVRTGRK